LAKSYNSERGFSLAEVAVATGILAVVSLGVAQMFALSTEKNLAAKHQVSTTTMATQKMEQLRGLTFSYDASGLGLPVTDTTTNLTLCAPDTSGHGLDPSPTTYEDPSTHATRTSTNLSIEQNISGFVDFVDGRGNCVSNGGTTPPATAVYTRRWAIQPLPTNPNNALVLSVMVTPTAKERTRAITSDGRTRLVEDAMLVTIRSRKAP
jgi:prepilin-type N-terminal cleavage/methylation domain-containing protein